MPVPTESPALVPFPRSLESLDGPPFRFTPGTSVTGDTDAVAAAGPMLRGRTGLALDGSDDRVVEFRREGAGEAESYAIAVDGTSVVVSAPHAAGLFYGMLTLGQLLTRDDEGWTVPAVRIEDAPRFEYRGVMLDVA